MYGQQVFNSGAGGHHGASQPPLLHQVHPNFNLFPDPNLLFIQQNPHFMPPFNPFFQNPNGFPPVQQQLPNINVPAQLDSGNIGFHAHHANEYNNTNFAQQQAMVQNELAEKVDKATRNAWENILNKKKSVSAWKVSLEALSAVNADSWESLGFQMQRVPSLKNLADIEGKINAFIHCFVAARRITSLHDLEVAICKSEGVEQFEELELGPLVQHPLAVDYFSLTSNVTEVYRIGTEEIISYLCQFIDTHKSEAIEVDTFLEFICKKQSVSGWENLCIRIQDFRLYVNHIKQAKQLEDGLLVNCSEQIRKETEKRSKKGPIKQFEDGLLVNSCEKIRKESEKRSKKSPAKKLEDGLVNCCEKIRKESEKRSKNSPAKQLEDGLLVSSSEKIRKESEKRSKKSPTKQLEDGLLVNSSEKIRKESEKRSKKSPAKQLEDGLLGSSCEKIRKESEKRSKKSPAKQLEDGLVNSCEKIRKKSEKRSKKDLAKQLEDGLVNCCEKIRKKSEKHSKKSPAKQLEDGLVKCGEKIRKESEKLSKKCPLISVEKEESDDHFNTVSQSLKSFASVSTQFCGKHTRFRSSSSEDDDGKDDQDEKNIDVNCNLPLPNGRSERVSSCPYPSIDEEEVRLGLKTELESTFYTPDGVMCDGDKKHSSRKRKYENMGSSTSLPHKLPKKEKFDTDVKFKRSSDQRTSGHSLSIESFTAFLATWKEACRDKSADEIVIREAIPFGPEDSSSISSLVNWLLPYAQRYIFKEHPDVYFQLKQSSLKNLRRLKIVVFEKLKYRYKIKKCNISSKRRHKCNCLLQENILYCRRDSDLDSIFLELSRLLFDGTPQLHFANFLCMITAMAQAGATQEQTEFFTLNSQKLPKLPAEESCWSLRNASSSIENMKAEELSSFVVKRKFFNGSKWPPADCLKTTGENSIEKTDICLDTIDINLAPQGVVLVDAEVPESECKVPGNLKVALDSVDLVSPDSKNWGRSVSHGNDEELAQHQALTGRLGEHVAFKYFTGRVGEDRVKWINEASETGLPYDIVLEGGDSSEYIEVKATRLTRKSMFMISIREWQFAVEKGESFSIAVVVLGDDNLARLTIYKNPARLCQLGNLKLALVVPKYCS